MTTRKPFGTFFLPGPTEVRHDTLAAMLQPMIPHRGAAFEALYARVHEGLQRIFRTSGQLLVSSSSATGLMEASVRCAPPGPVLSIVNGAFAERFAHVAVACGRETDLIEVPWGAVAPLEQVEERLRGRRYAAVTVVHSETSTGALTNVRAVTDLARRHGAFCLVDSVTGVAGAPLEFDAWELDFVFTGSQKALALPPGLAFAAASPAYMARATEAPARGVYFDLAEFARSGAKNQTPNTPALSLLYALEHQLAAIESRGGVEARWAAHAEMAATTWRWAESFAPGIGVLAAPGERSPTVTALTLPPTISPADVVKGAAERGYVIGSGYGKLRERTVRIGHMGDHTAGTLDGCLAAVGEVLRLSAPRTS